MARPARSEFAFVDTACKDCEDLDTELWPLRFFDTAWRSDVVLYRLFYTILIVGGLTATAIAILWNAGSRRSGFFAENYDSDALREDVGSLKSMIGLKVWRFGYHLPPQKTLFVIVDAEFDGKPFPGMSGTYQLVPQWPKVESVGEVQASIYEPQFRSIEGDSTQSNWNLSLSARQTRGWGNQSTGIGNAFSAYLPLYRSGSKTAGEGGSMTSAPDLSDGKLHQVWDHNLRSGVTPESQSEHVLKWTLSVRMAQLTETDQIGSVQPVHSQTP